jgi:hypothetical protein
VGCFSKWGKWATVVWNVCNTLLACDDYNFRQTMQLEIFCNFFCSPIEITQPAACPALYNEAGICNKTSIRI